MKFVKGSEKCPDKTAKLDAPEDNRDTEGSSMIWALFCYFQKKIRGQWIIVLWSGDVYIPVQAVPILIPLCLLFAAPGAPLAGGFCCRTTLFGLPKYYLNRGQVIGPRHLNLESEACCICWDGYL